MIFEWKNIRKLTDETDEGGADILLDFIWLLYYTTYEYTTHK